MYNHEPEGYECPFCALLREKPEETIARLGGAAALIGLHRWGRSEVDVLIIPVEHFENLYDLPTRLAPNIHSLTRAVARTLKAVYGCEGVSTRQHNEPAGNQDVWHYHIHVFPRYTGDDLYKSAKMPVPRSEWKPESEKLRAYMRAHWEELTAEPEQKE